MKVNKWKLPLYALVGIALLLGGVIIGQSLTSASTFWISSGVYPGAPSYTVWREGSTYFAKDAYGAIDYSGTNTSQIINNAITNTPLKGSVLITSGDYDLGTSYIWINRDDITFEGNGFNTYIHGNVGAGAGLIRIGKIGTDQRYKVQIRNIRLENIGNGDILRMYESGIYYRDCTFENIYIVGNEYNYQSAIHAAGLIDCIFHNFIVKDVGVVCSIGILSRCSFTTFQVQDVHDSVIDGTGDWNDVTVSDWNADCENHGSGISWQPETSGRMVKISDVSIWRPIAYGFQIYVDEGGEPAFPDLTIENCHVRGAADAGFYISGGSGREIHNVRFRDCTAEECGGEAFVIDFGRYISLTNCESKNNGRDEARTPVEYRSGFRVYNSLYTMFDGCRAYDDAFTLQTYGFYEGASTDYSMMIGCMAVGNSLMGIHKIGANTKVNLCWNNTVWIP